MKLVTTKFKSGGLNEKHVVATVPSDCLSDHRTPYIERIGALALRK